MAISPLQDERGLARNAVYHLRTKRGLSGRALSMQAGHCVSYVNKLESGLMEPSLRGFAQVAAALKMTPLEIWTVIMAEADSVRRPA